MSTVSEQPDLYVMRYGDETAKKAIIILHGWGQKGAYWYEIGHALSDSAQVHVVDLPGFGKSKPFARRANTAQYADLILEYIHSQKLKHITMIGHSFGGQISLKMERLEPQLFDKLVLVAPAFIKDKVVVTGAKVTDYFAKIKKKHTKAEQVIQPIFTGADYTKVADILKKIWGKASNPYYKRELKKIETPTLLIWGEKENVIPYDPAVIAKNIPKCKLKVVKGADHNLHMTHRDELIGIILGKKITP
jgi:pimeloyl-ACP methyl ester carboxylesterase